MVPQPSVVYPYGPQQVRGMMPMNAQFVQLPQGNTITVVNQSNLVGGSYIVPMQPSIGLMTKHNLSTNFNTINNNVYNSINNMGSVSEVVQNENNGDQNTNNLNGDHGLHHQIQNPQNLLQNQHILQPNHPQIQLLHQQQQIQHMQQLQHLHHLQQLNQPSLQQSNGGESLDGGSVRSTQKVTRPKQELPEVFNTTKHVHKEDGKET
jgi:hypothetical protein